MEIFGQTLTKEQVSQRIGHISQIAGTKRYVLKEGRAEGVEAVDVKTGSGLYYTVLPGRGMDIAWMEYKGLPVAHIAKSGITNSQYYDAQGQEWLRSFYAGLLTTCGLTQAGMPSRDGDMDLGLHGRISNTPAENITVETAWTGDNLTMRVCGTLREAAMENENIVLTREIISEFGAKHISINDTIVNEGYKDTPFMILYHINIGYPFVNEFSHLRAPISGTSPWVERFPHSFGGVERCCSFSEPSADAGTEVYFHEMTACDDKVDVELFNERLNAGVYVSYKKSQLPYFSQARIMKQQDYYCVIEPGNCYPEGRKAARENARLTVLRPGETRNISLEIGIIDETER